MFLCFHTRQLHHSTCSRVFSPISTHFYPSSTRMRLNMNVPGMGMSLHRCIHTYIGVGEVDDLNDDKVVPVDLGVLQPLSLLLLLCLPLLTSLVLLPLHPVLRPRQELGNTSTASETNYLFHLPFPSLLLPFTAFIPFFFTHPSSLKQPHMKAA